MPREISQGLKPAEDGYKTDRKACVFMVQGPDGPGSGLLVKWRGIPCALTNNHVLPDEDAARGALVFFDYTKTHEKDALVPCKLLSVAGGLFFCSPFLPPLDSHEVDAEHLDYVLVQIESVGLPAGADAQELWPGPDARSPPWRSCPAWVVGHPDGEARITKEGSLTEPDELTGGHWAFTRGGSSGSPVFLHAGNVPLLGIHYWGDTSQPGRFIRLPAIVTDLLKKEIIARAGSGFDSSNAEHKADVAEMASALASLPTQKAALAQLDAIAPSGQREGLFKTTFDASSGVMQLHGDPARGGGRIELASFTILPESDPWTVDDQSSLDAGNSMRGNEKVGVLIYRTADQDQPRKGEVIIFDLAHNNKDFTSKIGTAHAIAFRRISDREPRAGDVCCGFAYNNGSRTPDMTKPRKLVFGSLTFNLSGGAGTQAAIFDAFHGTNNRGSSDPNWDKWAAKEEQELVARIWEVYKNGSPYPPVPAVAPPPPATGEDLFQYEPYDPDDDDDQEEAQLGKAGTFGVVFRMRRLADGKLCAVKMIKKKVARDNGIGIDALIGEVKLLERVDHPHIVSYISSCTFKKGKVFAIVTELLDGGSLRDKIATPSPPTEQTSEWMSQVASALAYMHSLRMQHRDLKPDNVLFEAASASRAKIIDLGLACIVSSKASSRMGARSKVGTETYMSPEKALGEEYGKPDDIWALGCMLAELLLGRLIGTSGLLALNGTRIAEAVEASKQVHARLGSWVEGCLQKQPEKRPTAKMLERALSSTTDITDPPSPAAPPPAPAPAPSPALAPAPSASSTSHLPLRCSQDLQATYLPADRSDPRYKGTRGVDKAHSHYTPTMHADGAGAPFPLRHEVANKAAWLDTSYAKPGESTNWWFDFGPLTIARTLELAGDGRDWNVPADAAEIVGEGQWKNTSRRAVTRDLAQVPRGAGLWQVKTSKGWMPLTTNESVLAQIEADYCDGKAQLEYTSAYRLECGDLATERTCSKDGCDHHTEGNRSHMYYVDFEQAIECDGEACFRQVDLWYTLDDRREKPVRRIAKSGATGTLQPDAMTGGASKLTEAVKGSDIATLEKAIAAAEAAGVASDAVEAAKQKLSELKAAAEKEKVRQEAVAKLTEAVKGSDIATLEKAIAAAEVAGVASDAVVDAAKLRLEQLNPKPSAMPEARELPLISSAEIEAFMNKVGWSLEKVKAATNLNLMCKSITDFDCTVIAHLIGSGALDHLTVRWRPAALFPCLETWRVHSPDSEHLFDLPYAAASTRRQPDRRRRPRRFR